MPALLFMGRRWGVGADELALPSLCSMALRVMWSVALVVVLFETGGDLRGCGDGWVVYTYMVCSLSTFALSVVVEWGITRVSTRGSIADTRPRESLSGYLNVHMMLGAVQLVMAALGIVLITRFDSSCKGVLTDEALNILLIVVTTSQIMDVLVTCCCCVLMSGNPEEARGGGDEGYYERFPSTEIEDQWENRCHWLYRVVLFLTCGLFGGRGIRQTDFEQLARVMARIFHTEEYLDVVPSDIAAGIVLLFHKQRYQRRAAAARLRRSPSATGLYPSAAPKSVRAAEAVASAAAAAAGRVAGVGSRTGDKKAGRGIGGGELSLSCLRQSGDDEESRGEKLSLTGSAGDSGGGGGSAVPVGLQERSEGHDGFDRVRGRALLDVMNPEDRTALAEISRFSRYSLAIYTWYLYVFERPCCGACDLLCYSCTGRSRAFHRTRSRKDWTDADRDPPHADNTTPAAASQGGNGSSSRSGGGGGGRNGTESNLSSHGVGVSVRGDNWLGTHEAALLRVAGLHRECEVIHAQFVSGITETPYCVLVDHAWRCVVVSIRGTMSLDDCLCDLQADPVRMEESGRRWGFDGSGMYAHQGVLARAEWVRQDLEKEGHIRALLHGSGGGVDGEPGTRAKRPRCRGYSLRLTGHSLGGSTGALLAYMLRAEYPSTRCVCISPLGGLLNSPHAEECGEFVLSAALGEDVVPRLSVMAMERMRDEVLELVARTKVNKLTVMRSMVRAVSFPSIGRSGSRRPTSSSPSSRSSAFSTHGGGNGTTLVDDDDDLGGLIYSQDEEIPDTRYSAQLRRYRALVDQRRAQLPFPELIPAGRFVHYVKTHTARSCCRSHLLYTPVWAKPSDFADIVVSKRMFFDHIPTRTCPRFTETFEMLKREANEADASRAASAAAATAAATSAWGRGYGEEPS